MRRVIAQRLEGSQTSPRRLDSGRLRRASRFGVYLATLANSVSSLVVPKSAKTGGSRECFDTPQFYARRTPVALHRRGGRDIALGNSWEPLVCHLLWLFFALDRIHWVSDIYAKAAPLQALGGHPSHQPSTLFEDSGSTELAEVLPDVASRLARRSLSESKRRGEVGSFRRWGEVGMTTTSTRTKRRPRMTSLVLPILLFLALSGITLAEPVVILDPYFYRTPVSEAIDRSSKTVLGYYDETDGKVTPLSDPPRLTIPELHTLAVAYAQSILKQTSPKIIRDRQGVIVAIRIEGQDPAFSSVVLTPGFAERFADLLGKDCLVCVPNRQTVFLFPRLGSNMEKFSIPLRGIYHNSVWPVSTELFEWRGGALHSVRDFEPSL
jgi:hypothetical protein